MYGIGPGVIFSMGFLTVIMIAKRGGYGYLCEKKEKLRLQNFPENPVLCPEPFLQYGCVGLLGKRAFRSLLSEKKWITSVLPSRQGALAPGGKPQVPVQISLSAGL